MQKFILNAIVLIVVYALPTWAAAQNAYRCGNTYSQLPCPGGGVIDITDQRTAAQKDQTDLASSRAASLADALEKARLEQEKKDLAANTPLKTTADAKSRNKASTQRTKPKAKTRIKNEPQYFVAQLPGAKKKTAVSKEKPPKKDSAKL